MMACPAKSQRVSTWVLTELLVIRVHWKAWTSHIFWQFQLQYLLYIQPNLCTRLLAYQIKNLLTYQSILKSASNSLMKLRETVVEFLFIAFKEGPEGNLSYTIHSSDLYNLFRFLIWFIYSQKEKEKEEKIESFWEIKC